MGSLWDDGDIAGAVRKAKQLGAVFIVFIEGKNELSAHYGQLFSDEEVLKKLKTNQFVAIKVEQNSETHQQFVVLYPHSSTPCVFFIGKNGKPLEVVTKNITIEEFRSTINEVLERSGFSTKADVTATVLNEEKKSEVNRASSSLPNTGTTAVKDDSQPSMPTSSKELCPEDKVQHAKELIEQRKEAKKKQEEENERLRELERRKMGQNVQQMKKWQQDEELKQMLEERNREKRENQAARDRVLAQIAQDKAERAAKFSNQGSASIPQVTVQSSQVAPKRNTTRLQFRLPEGSVHTQEFQISDTLQRVHQYILNEITLPFANYTISTTFPRREFNEGDNSQSLLDLQLVPNAVILILPQMQGAATSSPSGIIGNMFWWLMSPILSIYDFLVGFIFGTPSIRRSETSTSTKRSASEVDLTNRNQPKKQATNTTEIKKQGNIHRLKDRPDTDDENNTWNGNSTQQM